MGERAGEASRLPLMGETDALHTSCTRCRGEGACDAGSCFTGLVEMDAGDPGVGRGWNKEFMANKE